MIDDQVIDPAIARSLHADAVRTHPVVGWIVLRDPYYPDHFVARLVTDIASPYILVADTLRFARAPVLPWHEPPVSDAERF
jgi:hypothetical protein